MKTTKHHHEQTRGETFVVSHLWNFCRCALLCLLLLGAGQPSAAQSVDEEAFHKALQSQNMDAAQRLFLRYGKELLTRTDSRGWLALHSVASSGSTEAMRFLLDNGADPNYKPADGYSPKIQGRTPLHMAMATGEWPVVSLLLKANADIFASDDIGNTPLHLAVLHGRKEIANQLIELMGEQSYTRAKNGTTPLHIAARQGHEDLVTRLLFVKDKKMQQRAAKLVASQSTSSESSSSDLLRLVDSKNDFGLSSLHQATLGGHENVVRLLLEQGAEVNSFNAQGLTPLFLASRDGQEMIVEVLSSHDGANLEHGDSAAHSPLSIAVANGHLLIFARLLRHGADPHSKNKNGMTALHMAAKKGNGKGVKSVLTAFDRGRINERDNTGNTPLLYAIKTGKKEIVEDLVQAGADVSVKNSKGETPLDLARKDGNTSIVSILER